MVVINNIYVFNFDSAHDLKLQYQWQYRYILFYINYNTSKYHHTIYKKKTKYIWKDQEMNKISHSWFYCEMIRILYADFLEYISSSGLLFSWKRVHERAWCLYDQWGHTGRFFSLFESFFHVTNLGKRIISFCSHNQLQWKLALHDCTCGKKLHLSFLSKGWVSQGTIMTSMIFLGA